MEEERLKQKGYIRYHLELDGWVKEERWETLIEWLHTGLRQFADEAEEFAITNKKKNR